MQVARPAKYGQLKQILAALQRSYILRIIGLLIVLLFIVWQLSALRSNDTNNVLSRIDSVLYDWRFQAFTPQRPLDLPIVIIDVDEFTQTREGRWPWDRSKVADLINNLHAYGAGLIAFDMVFSEAVDSPIKSLLDRTVLDDETIKNLQQQQENFDGDLILADTLDKSISLGFFLHNDGYDTGQLPAPLAMLNPDEIAQSALFAMPNYTANLDIFTNTDANSGFVVAIPDADGIIRRAPLLMRHNDSIYPSLSLELTRQALGIPWIKLQHIKIGDKRVVAGIGLGRKLFIPLDANGNILIPYKGRAKSFTTISATKVLQQDLATQEKHALDNAIVLVGTSALGLRDLRSTPLQTNYPGVEVHANVLDTLLQAALGENTLYIKPDWLPGGVIVLMLVLGVFLALFIPRKSPKTTIITTFLAIFLLIILNLGLWHYQHMDFPLAAPLLMTVALALTNIIFAYFIANKQRHTIQALFGEYVPMEHVNRMVANPKLIETEGEQREMTVLFADIRNFTNISENLAANELKLMLNDYLSEVTKIIFDHTGTVDKYVGDMVMAFWNAPLDDEKHANNAITTAINMQNHLIDLRQEFAQRNLPQINVGIGINTGNMNVGDMGSKYRRAYTVIGDAVNLAARLESLTSYYKLPILVSEFTRQQAPEFSYLLIDKVQVKGRQQAVDIYEPVQVTNDEQTDYIESFNQAVHQYRQRQWEIAKQSFNKLAQDQDSYSHLCKIYLSRMDEDPSLLPEEWDGVYIPKSK